MMEGSCMTLTGMLERNLNDIPEKTAIVFHDTRISYRELDTIVNKMANALVDMGLKKGDRVGLMLPRIPAGHCGAPSAPMPIAASPCPSDANAARAQVRPNAKSRRRFSAARAIRTSSPG